MLNKSNFKSNKFTTVIFITLEMCGRGNIIDLICHVTTRLNNHMKC